jgi:helicase
VLALVATKDAADLDALKEFFGKTFLAHQTDATYLGDVLSNVVEFLQAEGMVTEGDELRATSFGKRVSDLYIDPKSAVVLRDALKKYKDGHEFGLLHAVCATPNMGLLYLRQSDYEWIEEYLDSVKDELLIEAPSDLAKYEIYLSEVKTAKLVRDWISEKSENEIAEGFGIGPGDIRNKMEMAKWLMHATSRLSGLFNEEAVRPASELSVRVTYGIRPELLELVKLRGIGRMRARALYDRGIRGLEDLRNTSYDRLKQIPTMGEAVAMQIKAQLGQSDPVMPAEPEDGQSSLKDFR